MEYVTGYLRELEEIIRALDVGEIRALVDRLEEVRERRGRLFFLGAGGGAANGSHAVCDFRRIAGFHAFCASDNAAELTANANDFGWEEGTVQWLRGHELSARDAVFVLSVGGGSEREEVSVNLVRAIDHAKSVGARVFGIVGPDGGATAKEADVCIRIPAHDPLTLTTHTESLQLVLTHLLATHPRLKLNPTKWESVTRPNS